MVFLHVVVEGGGLGVIRGVVRVNIPWYRGRI